MLFLMPLLLSVSIASDIDFYQNRSYAQQDDLLAMLNSNSVSLRSNQPLEKVDHTFLVQEILPVRMNIVGPSSSMDENFPILKKSIHETLYEKQYKRCYPPIILVAQYLPKDDYAKLKYPNDIFYSTAYYFFVCDDCGTSKQDQIKTFVQLSMDQQCEQ